MQFYIMLMEKIYSKYELERRYSYVLKITPDCSIKSAFGQTLGTVVVKA